MPKILSLPLLLLTFLIFTAEHTIAAPTTGAVPADVFPGALLQTRYVWHLESLGLSNLLAQAVKDNAHNPSTPLFRSGLIFAEWPGLAQHPGRQAKLGKNFVTDVQSYLQANAGPVDGHWAINQAKFLFAYIVPPIVDRIEYWSATASDRAALAPIAALSQKILSNVDSNDKQVIAQLNQATSFTHADELAYQQAMNSQAEVSYYQAYADYYTGLAMKPTDAARKKILAKAVARAAIWIKRGPASGVFYQSLLLAGKAQLKAGAYPAAIVSLQKVQQSTAPLWVQYQGGYQQVVARMLAKHYRRALKTLNVYEGWIHSEKSIDSPAAVMGAQLLRYRLVSAQARAAKTPAQKAALSNQAATLALKIISTAPQYEQLIFSHLAGSLPAHPVFTQISPLQALAFAWLQAQKAQKKSDGQAVAAVDAILAKKSVNPSIRREALLIGGISNFRLGRLTNAVKMNLDFVKSKPQDPRAKHVLNLALYDIKQLNTTAQVSPQVSALISEALHLAYFTYHEKKWAFAYATQMQGTGHLKQAARAFKAISPQDQFYLDARYELVRLATTRLAQLAADKAPLPQQRHQARELLSTSDHFLNLLKYPPSAVPPEALKRARSYQKDIWLIEAGTALDPLHYPGRANQPLNNLDHIRSRLSARLQSVVLRYRIRQYQLENRSAMILPLVEKYALESSQKPTKIIEGLIGQYDRESRRARHTNPVKARRLAADAAVLMRQLIDYLKKEPKTKPDDIYTYRQILADELIRGAHGHQAMAIFKALEHENPKDLQNFIGVARAAYATGDYTYAHTLYVQIIPQLKPGSNLFWSAYLYLIRSNQSMGQNQAATGSSLKSLQAIYGDGIGGKYFHKQFLKLLASYNIQ